MNSCSNCRYSDLRNNALACMGQKGMPYVHPRHICESWKSNFITNYDKIMSMDIDQLTDFIAYPNYATPPWCSIHIECPYLDEDPARCDLCVGAWLREEAEP